MPTSNGQNQYVETELSFSAQNSMQAKGKEYYREQHKKLFQMKKNQLQLYGLDLIEESDDKVTVTAFIRSTVEKSLRLNKSTIVLLNKQSEVLAKTEVDFKKLGVVHSNTAVPWAFEFEMNTSILDELKDSTSWSLGFKKPSKHRLDLSDINEEAISEASKNKLEKILQETSLKDNELSLMGLSAKATETQGIEMTLLIQNGTKRDLEINKLPLNFYDAKNDLAAQGTFQLADFKIQANTSKPMTLVFPKEGILKRNMDLSRWSVEHIKG